MSRNGDQRRLAELYSDFRSRLYDAMIGCMRQETNSQEITFLEADKVLREWDRENGIAGNYQILDAIEATGSLTSRDLRAQLEGLSNVLEHIELKLGKRQVTSDGLLSANPHAVALMLHMVLKLVCHDLRRQPNMSSRTQTPPSSSTPTPAYNPVSLPQQRQESLPSQAESVSTSNAESTATDSMRRDSPVSTQAPEPKGEMAPTMYPAFVAPTTFSPSASTSPVFSASSPAVSQYPYAPYSPASNYTHNTPSTLSTSMSPQTPMSSSFAEFQDRKPVFEPLKTQFANQPAPSPPPLSTMEPPLPSHQPYQSHRFGLTNLSQYARQPKSQDAQSWPQNPASPSQNPDR